MDDTANNISETEIKMELNGTEEPLEADEEGATDESPLHTSKEKGSQVKHQQMDFFPWLMIENTHTLMYRASECQRG